IAPDVLHRRENAQLVVDHDVVAGRIALFDVIQHLFLMDVNQNMARDSIPQPRSLDLQRLEYYVAVGQDNCGRPPSEPRDDVVEMCHRLLSSARGLCQPPSPPTSTSASCAPHVFGS